MVRASVQVLSTWQRLLLLLLAIGGFAQIGYWAVVAEGIDRPIDSLCASWDRRTATALKL